MYGPLPGNGCFSTSTILALINTPHYSTVPLVDMVTNIPALKKAGTFSVPQRLTASQDEIFSVK
jgi:hypothetical protein